MRGVVKCIAAAAAVMCAAASGAQAATWECELTGIRYCEGIKCATDSYRSTFKISVKGDFRRGDLHATKPAEGFQFIPLTATAGFYVSSGEYEETTKTAYGACFKARR